MSKQTPTALLLFFSILCPPIAVYLSTHPRACSTDLTVNICLTLCFYLPGILHAWLVIAFAAPYEEEDEEKSTDFRTRSMEKRGRRRESHVGDVMSVAVDGVFPVSPGLSNVSTEGGIRTMLPTFPQNIPVEHGYHVGNDIMVPEMTYQPPPLTYSSTQPPPIRHHHVRDSDIEFGGPGLASSPTGGFSGSYLYPAVALEDSVGYSMQTVVEEPVEEVLLDVKEKGKGVMVSGGIDVRQIPPAPRLPPPPRPLISQNKER